MPKTILMHGPSGSGKDTQVDLLRKTYDCEKIGTGEMFRNLIDGEAEEFAQIRGLINEGKFVSSELTYHLFTDWVQKFDNRKNWVFVSVVRNVDQIPLLDELLAKYGRKLDLFLHFNLSEKDAIDRMSMRKNCVVCGRIYHSKYNQEKVWGKCDDDGGELIQRHDDKTEAIKKRVEEYNRTIGSILEEYAKRGILVEIDATPEISVINKEIVGIFNKLV